MKKRYTMVHYKKVANGAYDVSLCTDDGSCDKVHARGIMIHFELLNRELDDEASINIANGSIYTYYEYDPCRTRRYIEIELDAEQTPGNHANH
ncbi:MAG: hypothetical protein QXE01_04005 [Sulfolobales archaeon]